MLETLEDRPAPAGLLSIADLSVQEGDTDTSVAVLTIGTAMTDAQATVTITDVHNVMQVQGFHPSGSSNSIALGNVSWFSQNWRTDRFEL